MRTLVWLLPLLLGLAGCGAAQELGSTWGRPGAARVVPQGRAAEPAGLATLPVPAVALDRIAPRDPSITKAGSTRLGSAFVPELPSGHVSLSGSSLEFSPFSFTGSTGLAPFAYACYNFELADYKAGEPGLLRLAWESVPDPQNLYLGLADFSHGRWVWLAVDSPNVFALGDLQDYIGPQSQCLLIVALGGRAPIVLKSLSIEASNAPTAMLTLSSNEVQVFADVRLDASSSDAGGDLGDGIVLYEWDFEGDGTYDESTAFAYYIHKFQFGTYEPTVRVTDSQGKQASASQSLLVKPGTSQNHKPQAALSVAPDLADVDQPVLLDASASSDLDTDIVKYEWDLDNNGIFELNSGLTSSMSQVFSQPLQTVQMRVSDSLGNSDTASASVKTQAQPSAVLETASTEFPVGQVVTLDGSASSDRYGTLTLFEWDADGDGSFESSSGTQPTLDVTYNEPQNLVVQLRVTDDDGHSATSSLAIRACVEGGQVVVSAGDTGYFSSLALVEGRPAIAYSDFDSESNFASHLHYIRANDALGLDWGDPVTVDSRADAGTFPHLLVVDGKPAIAYMFGPYSGYYYVRAEDASGTAWGTPQLVSDPIDGVIGGDIGLLNGIPMVCFMKSDTVAFRLASDPDGTGWGPIVAVTNEFPGTWPHGFSLAEVNGRPAMSLLDASSYLNFVRASDSAGLVWPESFQVVANGNGGSPTTGTVTSLRVVNGNPAIAYYSSDGGGYGLAYLRAIDADGSAWPVPSHLDIGAASGKCASLQIIDGKPAIAYCTTVYGELDYIQALDSNGSAWAEHQILDSLGQTGWLCCLADINGAAAFSYTDYVEGDSDLKYLRLSP